MDKPKSDWAWTGHPDPSDPDNFWIDDKTGERVNARTSERTPPPRKLDPELNWEFALRRALGYMSDESLLAYEEAVVQPFVVTQEHEVAKATGKILLMCNAERLARGLGTRGEA